MWHRDPMTVRPAEEADRAWIERTLAARWGSTLVVTRGATRDAAALDAIVAVDAAGKGGDPERVGLMTYCIDGGALEVVTLDALVSGAGIGAALLEGATRLARQAGASRLWLTTTNDNLHAVGFYARRGLRIVAVHRGAVDVPGCSSPRSRSLPRTASSFTTSWRWSSSSSPRGGAWPQARLVPTAGVVIRDENGRLLLVKRADDGTWCLPGGRLEPGESWAACAVRECREETGLTVALRGLFGVYSDPADQVHTYPDGDRIQVTAVVFSADVLAGEPLPVDPREITASGFFAPGEIPAELMRCDAPIVADALSGVAAPFVR